MAEVKCGGLLVGGGTRKRRAISRTLKFVADKINKTMRQIIGQRHGGTMGL